MEIRVLKYFLTLCETGNITSASEKLNMTQPALSKRLISLEKELGVQLFTRGKRTISLTEAGYYMKKQATEIVTMSERAIAGIPKSELSVRGDIYIGAGESVAIQFIIKILKELTQQHPDIKFHFFNVNNRDTLKDMLERGVIDFALLSVNPLVDKFSYIKIPYKNHWGLLMRTDSPLASKDYITPEDMVDIPLISATSESFGSMMSGWLGFEYSSLNIVGTSFLVKANEYLVKENIGYAITRESVFSDNASSDICFKRFQPEIESDIFFIWPKNHTFSKAAELLLNKVTESNKHPSFHK